MRVSRVSKFLLDHQIRQKSESPQGKKEQKGMLAHNVNPLKIHNTTEWFNRRCKAAKRDYLQTIEKKTQKQKHTALFNSMSSGKLLHLRTICNLFEQGGIQIPFSTLQKVAQQLPNTQDHPNYINEQQFSEMLESEKVEKMFRQLVTLLRAEYKSYNFKRVESTVGLLPTDLCQMFCYLQKVARANNINNQILARDLNIRQVDSHNQITNMIYSDAEKFLELFKQKQLGEVNRSKLLLKQQIPQVENQFRHDQKVQTNKRSKTLSSIGDQLIKCALKKEQKEESARKKLLELQKQNNKNIENRRMRMETSNSSDHEASLKSKSDQQQKFASLEKQPSYSLKGSITLNQNAIKQLVQQQQKKQQNLQVTSKGAYNNEETNQHISRLSFKMKADKRKSVAVNRSNTKSTEQSKDNPQTKKSVTNIDQFENMYKMLSDVLDIMDQGDDNSNNNRPSNRAYQQIMQNESQNSRERHRKQSLRYEDVFMTHNQESAEDALERYLLFEDQQQLPQIKQQMSPIITHKSNNQVDDQQKQLLMELDESLAKMWIDKIKQEQKKEKGNQIDYYESTSLNKQDSGSLFTTSMKNRSHSLIYGNLSDFVDEKRRTHVRKPSDYGSKENLKFKSPLHRSHDISLKNLAYLGMSSDQIRQSLNQLHEDHINLTNTFDLLNQVELDHQNVQPGRNRNELSLLPLLQSSTKHTSEEPSSVMHKRDDKIHIPAIKMETSRAPSTNYIDTNLNSSNNAYGLTFNKTTSCEQQESKFRIKKNRRHYSKQWNVISQNVSPAKKNAMLHIQNNLQSTSMKITSRDNMLTNQKQTHSTQTKGMNLKLVFNNGDQKIIATTGSTKLLFQKQEAYQQTSSLPSTSKNLKEQKSIKTISSKEFIVPKKVAICFGQNINEASRQQQIQKEPQHETWNSVPSAKSTTRITEQADN